MTTHRLLLILVAALLSLAACKNADTITGVRTEPTPVPLATPTPIPTAVNIAGAWVGTFNSFDGVDCDPNVPAQATLAQQDSTVDGTLDAARNGCGTANVVIHATLTGGTLQGTIESSAAQYHFSDGSTVRGRLSGATLTIFLHDARGFYIPGGTMELHR